MKRQVLIFAKLIQLSLLSVNWIVKVFFVNVEEFVNDEFSQRNVFNILKWFKLICMQKQGPNFKYIKAECMKIFRYY